MRQTRFSVSNVLSVRRTDGRTGPNQYASSFSEVGGIKIEKKPAYLIFCRVCEANEIAILEEKK